MTSYLEPRQVFKESLEFIEELAKRYGVNQAAVAELIYINLWGFFEEQSRTEAAVDTEVDQAAHWQIGLRLLIGCMLREKAVVYLQPYAQVSGGIWEMMPFRGLLSAGLKYLPANLPAFMPRVALALRESANQEAVNEQEILTQIEVEFAYWLSVYSPQQMINLLRGLKALEPQAPL
jgi:hypothetical protein